MLIIAHPNPDSKFKSWVTKLRIEWMVCQARDALNMQHGFWKGLNTKNLGTVFKTPLDSGLTIGSHQLAEYDSLFSANFSACTNDIHSFISPRFALKPLSKASSDGQPHGDYVGDAEYGHQSRMKMGTNAHAGESAADAQSVSTAKVALGSPAREPAEADSSRPAGMEQMLEFRANINLPSMNPHGLESWLIEQLADGNRPLLHGWCQQWQEDVSSINNHQNQLIVRSLFIQSLDRLRKTSSISRSLADGLMTSELTERDVQPLLNPDQTKVALSRMAGFNAWDAAAKQFFSHIKEDTPSNEIRSCASGLVTQQFCFIAHFTMRSWFLKYWKDLYNYETIFTLHLDHGAQQPAMEPGERQFLRSKRELLLGSETASALRLKMWQKLALLLPGTDTSILTPCQSSIFREKFDPEHGASTRAAVDPSDLRPRPCQRDSDYPAAVLKQHPDLYKLFGKVIQARHEAEGTSATSAEKTIRTPSAPSERRPSLPHSQASPLRALDSCITPSRFDGKDHFTAKRAHSPTVDGRVAKFARLGPYLRRDDVAEDLQKLRAELGSEVEGLRQDLQKYNLARLREDIRLSTSEEIRAELGSAAERFLRNIPDYNPKQAVHEFRVATGEEVRAALGEDRARGSLEMNKLRKALDATRATEEDRFAQLESHVNNIAGALKQQKKDISALFVKQNDHLSEKLDAQLEDQGAMIGDHEEVLDRVKNIEKKVSGMFDNGTSAQREVREGLEGLKGLTSESSLTVKRQGELLVGKLDHLADTHGHALEQQTQDLLAKLGDLRTMSDSLKQQNQDLLAKVSTLTSTAENLQRDNQDLLIKLNDAASAMPDGGQEPGQHGYLDQFMAPAQWRLDQNTYQHTLHRAGWLYIHVLDAPEDGCWEDQAAWQTVITANPTLDPGHVEKAIEHTHVEAYGYRIRKT